MAKDKAAKKNAKAAKAKDKNAKAAKKKAKAATADAKKLSAKKSSTKKSGAPRTASTKGTAAGKVSATERPAPQDNPSIKDPQMYEALRDEGASKQKAARISNAAAATSRTTVGRRGGRAEDYTERTKSELLVRARELDIRGRSTMSKGELIDALRNH
ncbi:hypothetical protein SAMN05443377_11462 [Propionibacterium cyclohexanicum]|uniref:Rho termination factor, N-terminal domain n=1 Tax=Propionibacterium cyclohexanicum TaxID=64702 RepID=A0A1H9SP48_9ACTN|nr:Rho termination factor N-terminal domain-containing protein [Propionibacterium cyclohexanicum]SER86687.1 hypothetical protein SAMN05443377_11462 [Propionibacterium cyclohexanicum]